MRTLLLALLICGAVGGSLLWHSYDVNQDLIASEINKVGSMLAKSEVDKLADTIRLQKPNEETLKWLLNQCRKPTRVGNEYGTIQISCEVTVGTDRTPIQQFPTAMHYIQGFSTFKELNVSVWVRLVDRNMGESSPVGFATRQISL